METSLHGIGLAFSLLIVYSGGIYIVLNCILLDLLVD